MTAGPNEVNSVMSSDVVSATTVGTFGPYKVEAWNIGAIQTKITGSATFNVKTGMYTTPALLSTIQTFSTSTNREFTFNARYMYLNVSAITGTIDAVMLLRN
jgi:hypothetical protein